MAEPHQQLRRVEFRDTDAAGIAHFSVFFLYMEQAEHQLLRELGIAVVDVQSDATYSWPRVSVHCDYRGAVRFEDEMRIEVWVAQLGTKSVRYRFRFLLEDQLIAEGTTVAVYCRVDHGGQLTSQPLPPAVRQSLERHLIPDATV